jgi:hypothetical protein
MLLSQIHARFIVTSRGLTLMVRARPTPPRAVPARPPPPFSPSSPLPTHTPPPTLLHADTALRGRRVWALPARAVPRLPRTAVWRARLGRGFRAPVLPLLPGNVRTAPRRARVAA